MKTVEGTLISKPKKIRIKKAFPVSNAFKVLLCINRTLNQFE